jgi:hypothetical protein
MTELTIRILRTEDPDPTPESYTGSTPGHPAQQTLITYGSRMAGPVRQSRRIRQVKEAGRKRKITITQTMSLKDLKVQVSHHVVQGRQWPIAERRHK